MLRRHNVDIKLPATSLEASLDHFTRVATFDVPPISLRPNNAHVILPIETTLLDWYAISAATHPYGRTFGTEHRSRTARVRGSSLSTSNGWSRVIPTVSHIIAPPSNGSSFHLPTLFHMPHRVPGDPPPVQLVATTRYSATLRAPIGYDSSMPVRVRLEALRLQSGTNTRSRTQWVASRNRSSSRM